MGDAARPSGKVALKCHSHGYLLYLEAKNICIHHSSDKGEIVKECISPDFFHCKWQNPIPKCLKHITDKSGGESETARSRVSSKVIEALSVSISSLREGNGTPLQYSYLENPMDGGAWWAAFHGVTKSRTQLSDFTFTFHFHALEKEMATHSSVLAWRIPRTGEPGGLLSMGLPRVGHNWSDLASAAAAASPLSLSFLCFCDTFMVRQPLSTWWQDGCLQPSAYILPDKNPQEKPSFLVFSAKIQNPVSDSAWLVLPSLKQLWQPSRWYTLVDQAKSCPHPWCWGWGKPSELRVEGECPK